MSGPVGANSLLIIGGRWIAIIAGSGSAALSFVRTPVAENTAAAGIIVAISGLFTTVGAQLYAFLKLYYDQRRFMEEATLQRNDLSNKLNAAYFEVQKLQKEVKSLQVGGELNRNASSESKQGSDQSGEDVAAKMSDLADSNRDADSSATDENSGES